MADSAQFEIGSEVSCSDGPCGKLSRLVVDPVARTLAYLVVKPPHGVAKLVPIEFVQPGGGPIRLTCTNAQFEVFERAEEDQLLPSSSEIVGYTRHDVLELPYYGMQPRRDVSELPLMGEGRTRRVAEHDSVPVGEVEIRRGEHVHATDGAIGRVEGLVVNPVDHGVTHVLLQEGHLFGHKTVAIPIGAVESVNNGVRLTLSKHEVRDLPPLDVARPS